MANTCCVEVRIPASPKRFTVGEQTVYLVHMLHTSLLVLLNMSNELFT